MAVRLRPEDRNAAQALQSPFKQLEQLLRAVDRTVVAGLNDAEAFQSQHGARRLEQRGALGAVMPGPLSMEEPHPAR